MLTGRRAFEARSHASLIATILEHEPAALSAVQPTVPRHLEHVVRRCLAKSPDERWQTAVDLHRELKWVAESIALEEPRAVADVDRRRVALWRRPIPVGAGVMAAVLCALVAGIGVWTFPRAAPTSVLGTARLTIPLPPGSQLEVEQGLPGVAISPAGTNIAYVGVRAGRQQLYLRAIDSAESKALLGTEAAFSPFFSPDGQWIGFFAQGKLKKFSIATGITHTLCDAPFGVGGSWGPDGNIYFAATYIAGISKVSADGGTPTGVTRLDRAKGEVSHRWPQVLPGGNAVIFTVWTGPASDEKQVEVQRLDRIAPN